MSDPGDPWRVEFHAAADIETIGLAPGPFKALVTALREVARDPWTAGRPSASGDGPAWRWISWGDGYGVAEYYISPDSNLVTVYRVVWIG
ncbi:hypothetical protein [Actinomadura macrotermitis]|uniref:Type II toxin-antitoxin system RelE/ParE family toxin n=1 Tax=Actinomadura macrotermitis TaxID=2585200 RepID=A0A7K0C8U2_9ACTN|nr:hypothetical protein [Actinomadura macrotermitis]MQY09889.1 hypothetical protein [Actinomadura macrotermitis]